MSQLGELVAALLLPLGIAQCFFGYRIFKFLLGLSGFIVGAALGAMLAGRAGALEVLLSCLALGVVGATLAIWLYFVGIFLTGAVVGGGLGLLLGTGAESEGAALVLGLLGGIAGGIVALKVQKFVIIFSTAAQGAASIVGGAMLATTPDLLTRSPDRLLRALFTDEALPLGAWLLLLIAGIVVQYRTTAKSRAVSGTGESLPPDTTGAGPHLSIVPRRSEAGASPALTTRVSSSTPRREDWVPRQPEARLSVASQRREPATPAASAVRPSSTTPAIIRTAAGSSDSASHKAPSHEGGAWQWPGGGG